jgi:cytochrome P450
MSHTYKSSAKTNHVPNPIEWHSVPLRPTVARLVARMAFRIFLGEPMCRDEAWLDLATQYATTGWNAANELRDWPKPLRPLVHWFLPLCTRARGQVKQARAIIGPYAEERRRLRAAGHKFNDALDWFEEASKGAAYDPAIAQLILSLAALHGTTDLICQVMTQIAKHPELIEPLRAEASSVIKASGLTQKGLYQMKFMDSFVKECQRMKPIHSGKLLRSRGESAALQRWLFLLIIICSVCSHDAQGGVARSAFI